MFARTGDCTLKDSYTPSSMYVGAARPATRDARRQSGKCVRERANLTSAMSTDSLAPRTSRCPCGIFAWLGVMKLSEESREAGPRILQRELRHRRINGRAEIASRLFSVTPRPPPLSLSLSLSTCLSFSLLACTTQPSTQVERKREFSENGATFYDIVISRISRIKQVPVQCNVY